MFDRIDTLFDAERGRDGEPSVHDFLVVDLTKITAGIAEHFEDLPELISGRDDYRLLVGAGVLVRAFAATVQRAPDGSIDLLRLDIDLGWYDTPPA
ncbi:MAG: hypothetical protein ACTHN0_10490 [Aquihabitans sp.]